MRIAGALKIAVCLVLATGGLGYAQLSKPEIADQESGLQVMSLQKNDGVLYNMRWTMKRVVSGGQTFLIHKMKGDNNQQGAGRIEWDEKSTYEESAGMIRTKQWKKRSTGAEQMDWEINYDWDRMEVSYSWADRAAGKQENRLLKLDDKTLPGDALYLILRGFPFEKSPGYKITGRVVTDGQAMQGEIIHRGEETIETPRGKIACYKLELKPADLTGLLPTKFYMWFDKQAPHLCVRFDGLEGLDRTKTLVHEFSAGQ